MYNDRLAKKSVLPIPKRQLTRRSAAEDKPLWKRILFSSLWGLLANFVSGLILITITCVVAYSSPDPLSLIPALSLLALLPSNFLGGLVAVKRCGDSKIACGITVAAMWGVLSLLGSLCLSSISSSGYELWQGLLLHATSLAFCLLGAVAGGIKRPPSRKKRRFK